MVKKIAQKKGAYSKCHIFKICINVKNKTSSGTDTPVVVAHCNHRLHIALYQSALPHQDRSRGTVTDRRAHRQSKRIRDRWSVQHVFDALLMSTYRLILTASVSCWHFPIIQSHRIRWRIHDHSARLYAVDSCIHRASFLRSAHRVSLDHMQSFWWSCSTVRGSVSFAPAEYDMMHCH